MSVSKHSGLSELRAPVMMQACIITALCLLADCAFAQQQPQGKRDDLDVTMQIIVDPDAKLPDEVVRRIPLPARSPGQPQPRAASSSEQSDASATQPAQPDRSAAGHELGREMSERARERRQDAAEQREEARRSAAEERRRRDRGRPEDPPGRPRPGPRR